MVTSESPGDVAGSSDGDRQTNALQGDFKAYVLGGDLRKAYLALLQTRLVNVDKDELIGYN
jgi:hypothetical protein